MQLTSLITTTLLSLVSILITQVDAQASHIRVPAPGDVIQAGKNMTVQIVRPNSIQGSIEVGLSIGLLFCNTTDSPNECQNSDSHPMGRVLYAGQYNPVLHEIPGNPYQNFSLYVPTVQEGGIPGQAQIQVARLHLIGAGPYPALELYNVSVVVSASSIFTIHPAANANKCVGLVGGVWANGTPVDIYDCNGSDSQKWQWIGNSLATLNPTQGTQWCLDAGTVDQLTNGTKMKIWQCLPDSNLPQQNWKRPPSDSGPVQLSVGNYCLDLTNGDTTNRNVLQVWTCAAGNANQNWRFTSVQF